MVIRPHFFLTLHHLMMNPIIHPHNADTSLNDTSSYKTINKTRDTNPSYSRTRHPTDSSSRSSLNDTSQKRHLKSHDKLRPQPRKDYRLFLSPSKVLKH